MNPKTTRSKNYFVCTSVSKEIAKTVENTFLEPGKFASHSLSRNCYMPIAIFAFNF